MKSNPPAPDAYFMDPLQQVAVFTEMEKQGESLLAIYHSHPKGPLEPSGADLQLAFHPEAVYLIVSLKNREKPDIGAFILDQNRFEKISIEFV